MIQSKYICDFCGNEIIPMSSYEEPFSICHGFGYESNNDGSTISIQLCGKCADELTEYMLSKCKNEKQCFTSIYDC